MPLETTSFCKVNFVLNILGKRADGFHELETLMHPVPVTDRLVFEKIPSGVRLTCNRADLPTDSKNLAYRAAAAFLQRAALKSGVQIHLEKRIPLAAGLGGGSGNAACTLLALNEMFDQALGAPDLQKLAAELGSDVPFFLQSRPALATGRGERIKSLDFFPALKGAAFLLVHPGFGISTAWAYQNLQRFPKALNGQAGRAEKLASLLMAGDLRNAGKEFYNSLEAPALEKYPILVLFEEFFRDNGAAAALMSGSGSTTFAVLQSRTEAEKLLERFKSKFGETYWTAVAGL